MRSSKFQSRNTVLSKKYIFNREHPLMKLKNPLKKKLKDSDISVAFGLFIITGSTFVVECISTFCFDWLLIDIEGSAVGKLATAQMFQAMTGTGVTPLARIPVSNGYLVEQILDLGALGILAPKIEDVATAREVVSHSRYPVGEFERTGKRGVNPFRAKAWYSDIDRFYEKANEQVLTIIQIETERGCNNAEEILSVEGIDIVFIGPGDLSLSLGTPGNYDSEKMQEARNKILDAAKAMNIIPGIYAHDIDLARKYMEEGFRFISLGSDISLLRHAARSKLEQIIGISDTKKK